MQDVYYGIIVSGEIAGKAIAKYRFGDGQDSLRKLVNGPDQANEKDLLEMWQEICDFSPYLLHAGVVIYSSQNIGQVFIGAIVNLTHTQIFKRIESIEECVSGVLVENINHVLKQLNLTDFNPGFFHGNPKGNHEENIGKSRLK